MFPLTYLDWRGALAFALVAGACSTLILRVLLRTGLAWRLATDIPNERSLHERPTPRVGGWGLVPVAVALIALATPPLALVGWLALGLAAMSQIDDRRGLPARVRFGGHVVAVTALLAVYPAPVPVWMLPAIAIALLWAINLYNFMDGADGLAGGMAVFGFGAYTIAAFGTSAAPTLGAASAVVAGAAAGFLLLNFHPARLFLGDAGSIPLGFLAGALGYWGWRTGTWSAAFPLVVFGPFIFDASVTLSKRLLRGEKFWQPHREHYYQRVVRMGAGHIRLACGAYLIMAAGAVAGLSSLSRSTLTSWLIALAWYAMLGALALTIDIRWRRHVLAQSQFQ
ncbi:MraY family glycosyltransferase [Burkholderia gladioli]|uniref:MraY family glycosyltransferase n=1 Tax=Burkholderia gladioli TaxID=28095 RepID=UPI001CAE262D|nr:glycosyltransferase family 4 protein [Burkholderia gladioli]CAG9208181.1 Glycosyl transferase, family 4 [Burkholderia gladioli]